MISGTLWWTSAEQSSGWGAAGWRKELDQQRKIGFDLLWLTNTAAVLDHPSFELRDLLDLCSEFNMQVVVDTGFTGDWFGRLDLKTELDYCRKHVRALAARCANHPALLAWYIPHEIYMCWGPMDDYVQQLYPALVETCKNAALLPVTLSPFFILDRTRTFGDFRYSEPEEYRAYWAKLIKRAGIDIIMLQDSGEHFSYVTNEQRRLFFQAMSSACREAGARFWGNVEVAEMVCTNLEEYVRLYGRVHHSVARDIPWRPVPLPRLKDKLTLASLYSERIVSWGYQQFCRPDLGKTAEDWYRAYHLYQSRA